MTNDATIYGQNANSIAAILQYIQFPNHPMHEQAKEMAAEFIEAHRQEGIARQQRMMREQMEHISEEEWSSIVD
jgi:type IV pilus biogenesis protein CpaD/CtpE